MKKFNLEDIPSILVYLIFKVERIETLLRNRTSERAGESGKCRKLVDGSMPCDWVDNKSVMQMLNCSVRTMQSLRSKGLLPYAKLNGQVFYRRHDIVAALRGSYQRKER